MKYRKKPVVIEAFQWDETVEMKDMLIGMGMECGGFSGHVKHPNLCHSLRIKTLEGYHNAKLGDFIIKGVKGEFYPCKPDIFEMTYEAVDNFK